MWCQVTDRKIPPTTKMPAGVPGGVYMSVGRAGKCFQDKVAAGPALLGCYLSLSTAPPLAVLRFDPKARAAICLLTAPGGGELHIDTLAQEQYRLHHMNPPIHPS